MLSQFTGNIGRVEAGQIIVIVGKTIDAASRLDLNLKSGKNEEDTIVLNLSVRFHENIIVRNTWQNGDWGQEERNDYLDESMIEHSNPIVPGEIFKFYILIGDQKFHIAVNNQSYSTFAYRFPLEQIRTIEIKYDLQFLTQVDQRSAFPFPFPPVQFDDPRNVFSNDFPKPFEKGHLIIITGIPYGNPKGWFLIRFTEGASKRQALHFNARFDPHFVVVRNNANENSEYGPEERSGRFPFIVDQQFKLAIALTEKEFRFAVDGEYFGSFAYRTQNVLEKLNGFKMSTSYGMYMEITSVDHLTIDSNDCYGFESYSHPDVGIY